MPNRFWKVLKECSLPKDLDYPAWHAVHQHPVVRQYSQLCSPCMDNASTKTNDSEVDIILHEVLADYSANHIIPRILLESHISEMEAFLECVLEWDTCDHASEKLKSVFRVAVANCLQVLKQNLETMKDPTLPSAAFKRSIDKSKTELAFIPTNLHLQSFMVSQSSQTKRKEICLARHDVVTVGAFTVQFLMHDLHGLCALWSRFTPMQSGSCCASNSEAVPEDRSLHCDPACLNYPPALSLLRTAIRLAHRIRCSHMMSQSEEPADMNYLAWEIERLRHFWIELGSQTVPDDLGGWEMLHCPSLTVAGLYRTLGDVVVSAYIDLDITHALQLVLREHCVYSQLLTAVVSGILSKICVNHLDFSREFGFSGGVWNILLYFESLLSCWDDEKIMVEDVIGAIVLLSKTEFVIPISSSEGILRLDQIQMLNERKNDNLDFVYSRIMLPSLPQSRLRKPVSENTIVVRPYPVFLNVGINEKATIAENMECAIGLQKLNNRFYSQKLLDYIATYSRAELTEPEISQFTTAVRSEAPKNTTLLQSAEKLVRHLGGIRFTMCKSAKDRTAMAVTLEELTVVTQYASLTPDSQTELLEEMRKNGTRRENTIQNIGYPKYAFTDDQMEHFPPDYRAPAGTFGKAET
ncbi:uncharacterized protein LOC129589501 isoform X2 [Paramacrobiotus metropolitanus]|uniref:uncharacterized protein LOC129589501 isoform X2 n=1 Tax=Paramacrobiotus metropolitanus TaxID=2943436 RepID=UPI002446327F|nr:uncharacterized protein LOC129589501 isoform X2 [Paramacrobiotus metropolitanus]